MCPSLGRVPLDPATHDCVRDVEGRVRNSEALTVVARNLLEATQLTEESGGATGIGSRAEEGGRRRRVVCTREALAASAAASRPTISYAPMRPLFRSTRAR